MNTPRSYRRGVALLLLSVALVATIATNSTNVACAQSLDPSTRLPLDPHVRTGTLPNGLRYYIRHNVKPEHRAFFHLVVHAGAILEDDDQNGLAHLNEHMAFNGTKEFPKQGLVNFLESNGIRFGADLNAYTNYDETLYMLNLPTDRPSVLDSGLDVLSEWAHNVTFDSIEVEKERGVVGEEWRLWRGAQQRIEAKQLPITYKGSKYAERDIIGKKAIIDTAHVYRVHQFYKDWYRPDLMAVIAVGDFDVDKMEQAIKARFAPLQNPAVERPKPDYKVPLQSEPLATVETDKEMPYTIFQVLYRRPELPLKTVADYKHRIEISLFNQMLNQRLNELVKQGKATFAYAGVSDGRDRGGLQSFGAFAILKQDSGTTSIEPILREIYRVQQHGFTATELERAKASLLARWEKLYKEREKTESNNLVFEYQRNFLYDEAIPGVEYEYSLYQKFAPKVTLGEENALTHELLDTKSRVLTYAGVESPENHPPRPESLLAALTKVEGENVSAYADNVTSAPLMAKTPKAGKIVSEKTYPEIGVTEWKLSNGARVIVRPTDFKDDEILFRAFAPGGHSTANDDDYVSADNSNSIVGNSGVAEFDATQLAKMLAGKKLQIAPSVSAFQDGLEGQSTTKDFETMMQLVHLYMAKPRYDSVGYISFMHQMQTWLENQSKSPEGMYYDTVSVTLTQGHYRARPSSMALLKEIDPHKAYDYYRSHFSDAGNFTYLFVGNVDLKTLRPMVEQYIASLPSSNKHAMWRDVGIRPPTGIVKKAVYKGTEPKSMVSIVFPGVMPFTPQNRFKMSAMAQAVQIKLREDLREDKSGVYYVNVRPNVSKIPYNSYSLTVNFGCDPKRVDELVTEMMRQIDTISDKGLPPIYTEKVKEISRRENETNLKENSYWMQRLQDALWNDLDINSVNKASSMIESLTPDDIRTYAKQYFNRNNYVQVVLYPESKM